MSTPEATLIVPAAPVPGDPSSPVRVLSVEVEDKPGVLFRVCGMVQRRGFNIEGLSVGRAETPGRSRMTLTVHAGHAEVDQVEKQLSRLIEVISIQDLTDYDHLRRELALFRLPVTGDTRRRAIETAARAGASVVDVTADEIVIEVAGDPGVIEGLREGLGEFGVSELARSGPIAMRTQQE